MKLSSNLKSSKHTIPVIKDELEPVLLNDLIETLKITAETLSTEVIRQELTDSQHNQLRALVSLKESEDNKQHIMDVILKIQEENYTNYLCEYLRVVRTLQPKTVELTFEEWMQFENIGQAGFLALKDFVQITASSKIVNLMTDYYRIREDQQTFLKDIGIYPIQELEE